MKPVSLCLAGLLVLGGCSSISGDYPRNNSIIPSAAIRITEGYSISLENLVLGGAAAAAVYLIVDPLAPNWRIEQAQVADDRYAFALKMKRFHSGGDGEARVVFHRRARELAQKAGYAGYEVLSWQEGIESTTFPASQRVAEGSIRLVDKLSAPLAQN